MLRSDLHHQFIIPRFEVRVLRMPRFFVGIVGASVVATNERPTRVLAPILVRTVQQIRVKEHRVTGFEIHIDPFEAFARDGNSFRVGTRLLSDGTVIDATDPV